MAKYLDDDDPSEVVIDEVVGMGISLFMLPHSFGLYLLAFILFRIFDIWKPLFIKQMEKHNNLVILRSLSKIGLAGLRVGYGIFPVMLAEQVNKVRLPYNSNSISQWVANELLNDFTPVQNQIHSIVEERDRLMDELSKFPGITAYPSNSNFILFRAFKDGEKVFTNLKANGTLLRNLGSHPRLKNCLRVTIGTKQENDQFLSQLRKAAS